MKQIALSLALVAALMCCSCRNNAAKSGITPEQAFEGVSNYCHGAYDWSVAEDKASIMTLEMGEHVPALNITEDAGTIELKDYL